MKTFGDEALAALERGDAVVGGALEIMTETPFRAFSGYGTGTLDGHVYKGIGASALVSASSGALGGAAQNLDLVLTGIVPDVAALLDADDVRRAPATARRLIWAPDAKTLLGAYVFNRGVVDQLGTEEVVGGTASIKCTIENAARGLGRRGGRMRSDADQRLISPTDGFLKNVAFAAEKTLSWGGKKSAAAGSVLTGAVPGGGAGGARFSLNEALP